MAFAALGLTGRSRIRGHSCKRVLSSFFDLFSLSNAKRCSKSVSRSNFRLIKWGRNYYLLLSLSKVVFNWLLFMVSILTFLINVFIAHTVLWRDSGINLENYGKKWSFFVAHRIYLSFYWNAYPEIRKLFLDVFKAFDRFWHTVTAWKLSKYGVFSGPYFPAFGLNTDQKKLRIWTLFTQWGMFSILEWYKVKEEMFPNIHWNCWFSA